MVSLLLSTTRRVRLHVRIIDVLEDIYKDSIETHAVNLAYHAAEAEAIIGPEKLVRYAKVAGERALASYAHEEALIHFQKALTAKSAQQMDAQAADILFGLGLAQLATLERLQIQEADISLGRAFDYYVEAGDEAKAVAVVANPIRPQPGEVLGRRIARALELVPPDSHQAGRLLSQYCRYLSDCLRS